MIRIGQGIDVHPFASGRKLILGGVEIPHPQGLVGHSDADALTHAICDAILGALALGDIGQHFPDTDPKQKDRPSLEFLAAVVKMAQDKGWKIGNVDSTVVTEEPKLSPHIEKIRASLAKTLDVRPDQVSVKATRPEKIGALGRKEGLMATSIALLSSRG